MADTAGPAAEPGLEARVARLESDVGHIRGDIAEIKATLNRLAPLIDEFRGFMAATLPTLATKVELGELRTELKSDIAELRAELKSDIAELRAELKSDIAELRAELRMEILQRPTRRQAIFDMFAIVALVGAVLAVATHFAR
jgi:chromosome segregation ATPase